jgi:hypothetical protein
LKYYDFSLIRALSSLYPDITSNINASSKIRRRRRYQRTTKGTTAEKLISFYRPKNP